MLQTPGMVSPLAAQVSGYSFHLYGKRRAYGIGLCTLLPSAKLAEEIVLTRYRVSNRGQLNEHGRILVSEGLTLLSARSNLNSRTLKTKGLLLCNHSGTSDV